MITLDKTLRTPLAALLPLDVWEVNIHNSNNLTLVLSDFSVDVYTAFISQMDVLGSERGVSFSIKLEEVFDEEGNCMGSDFLQFTIHWGRQQAMAIHTSGFQVTSDARTQTMITAVQDVINALLETQMPLDPGVALDWVTFIVAELKRFIIRVHAEGW
jgi:hypothetical protein